MRRPSVFLDRREELDVAMTPMIDVVFLLLIFFVWTASFQVVEYMIPTAVAKTQGSDPADTSPPPAEADFDSVVIQVRPGPVWDLNGQIVVDLPQLRQRLSTIAEVRQETPAIVHPLPDVLWGAAVDAYDAARAAGLQKVAFAISVP